jgi:hypothetical protein
VFRANIDGKTLSVDLEGLKGLNFVMRDRQTRSLWQQATGVAFEGPLKGKRLELVDFLLTTWGEWRKLHPDTLAVMPDPKYLNRYRGTTQSPAQGSPAQEPPAARGSKLVDDPRLRDREQIVGIEGRDAQKAYPIALLRRLGIVNDQVGSTPVLLVITNGDTINAFSRKARGRNLTFQTKPGTVDLVDKETGSTWTPYGECTSGQLKGTKLVRLTPLPSFWFSWAQFFPKTDVYSSK